jgi:hypothetical protein
MASESVPLPRKSTPSRIGLAATIRDSQRRCRCSGVLSAFSTKGTVYLAEIGDLSLALQELIINTIFAPSRRKQPPPLWHEPRTSGGSQILAHERGFLLPGLDRYAPDFPLRCRKSEILAIADDLLTQYSKQFDRPKPVLREEIIEFLMEHTWPENLPELQTAIKTFVAIGDQSISLAALKAAASTAKSNGRRKPLSLKDATRAASAQIERQLISEVLVATGGNRKRAADELGISYKALLYKLKQVGAEYQPAPTGTELRYETGKAWHASAPFGSCLLLFAERRFGRRACHCARFASRSTKPCCGD